VGCRKPSNPQGGVHGENPLSCEADTLSEPRILEREPFLRDLKGWLDEATAGDQ
jgi:hypothetical protein